MNKSDKAEQKEDFHVIGIISSSRNSGNTMFSKFVARGKELDTKAVYENLACRGLI